MYNIIHVMENVTNVALVGIVVLIVTAGLIVLERKVLGSMQLRAGLLNLVPSLHNRKVGPQTVDVWGVLQPFADAVKLLAKESMILNHANKIILLLAPIISLVLVAGIVKILADINIGILYLFAVSSLGAYAVLCSGWTSNSRYSCLGVLRAESELVSGFHTEYSAVLFFLLLYLYRYQFIFLFVSLTLLSFIFLRCYYQ